PEGVREFTVGMRCCAFPKTRAGCGAARPYGIRSTRPVEVFPLSPDAPFFFDVVPANAIHALVEPNGRIAVMDPGFDSVSHIHGDCRIMNLNNCMLRVKGEKTNAFDVLNYGQSSFSTEGLPTRIDDKPLSLGFADDADQQAERRRVGRSKLLIRRIHCQIGARLHLSDAGMSSCY